MQWSIVNKEPTTTNNNHGNGEKRNWVIFTLCLVFGALGILFCLYWLLVLQFEETTDDAYVGGNSVTIMSRVAGTPIAYYVDDTDYVEQGQLIVMIDPTDYKQAFEREKSNLALAARQVKALDEDKYAKMANVALQKAQMQKALTDFQNRESLVSAQAVSREDFDHAKISLQVAMASVKLAKYELSSTIASLGTTPLEKHPSIESAKTALRIAYLNLKRCSVLAPVRGFVARRMVQAGSSVKTDTPLMSIIPLDNIWIEANFLETQLEHIRLDQPVKISVDIYGSDAPFHGKVLGIGAGTGSVFSILPPQNATGNWIKIAQRVPVRIKLDPEEVRKHPLRLGLSTTVEVNTHDRTGKVLANLPATTQVGATSIYDNSLDDVEALINEIIKINLTLPHGT